MNGLFRELAEPAGFVWLFCVSVALVCLWVAFAVFSQRVRRRLLALEMTDDARVRQWLHEREVGMVCATAFRLEKRTGDGDQAERLRSIAAARQLAEASDSGADADRLRLAAEQSAAMDCGE